MRRRIACGSRVIATASSPSANAPSGRRLRLLKQHGARVERAERLLAAFSYRGVLARGFALVRDGDGHPLRSATSVTGRMRLDIEFSDGRVAAVADGEGAASPPAAPKAKAAPARRRRVRRAGQPVRSLAVLLSGLAPADRRARFATAPI